MAELANPDTVFGQKPNPSLSNPDDVFGQPQRPRINIPEGTLARRMNNPGNLKFAGQRGAVEGEQGFAQFQTPEDGYQALQRQIDLDARRGHTVQSFITKYAPPAENDTAAYINFVQSELGVSPEAPVADVPRDALARAIALQESGTEIPRLPESQQETQPRQASLVDPGSVFGPQESTVGEPWKRGVQQAYNGIIGGTFDFLDHYSKLLSEATGLERGGLFGDIANKIYESSAKINAKPPTGKYRKGVWRIIEEGDYKELLDPKRLYQTAAEGLPTMGALMLTTMANPTVGTAAMIGMEGGSTVRDMELYEAETGEEIDPTQKWLAPILVGSANAALERVGIDKVLRSSKNAPGLKRKIFNILTTGFAVEGPTEAAQEITQVLAESGYEGKIPEDTGQRVVEAFYAGSILGMAGSAGANIASAVARPAPQDAELIGTQEQENVSDPLNPLFKVTNPEHELYGETVTLEELEQTGLEIPDYRRDLLKIQMMESIEDFGEVEAEHAAIMVDRMAQNANMTTDEFIDKHIAAVVKGQPLSKGDLRQAMSDIIRQFHFSENEIRRVNQPSQDPLASAIRNRDTGEVVYGYRGQFHQDLVDKMGWSFGQVDFGFADNQGRFVDRRTALRKLRDKYPEYEMLFRRDSDFGLTSELLIRADERFDEEVYFQYEGLSPSYIHRLVQEFHQLFNKGRTVQSGNRVGRLPEEGKIKRAIRRNDRVYIADNYGDYHADIIAKYPEELEGIDESDPRNLGFVDANGKYLGSYEVDDLVYEELSGSPLSAIDDAWAYISEYGDIKETLGKSFFQAAKGAINFAEDGRATIKAFKSADVSTMMHELGHLFRRTLNGEDLVRAEDWVGVTDGNWTRENEETFARTFERWLAEGRPRDHTLSAVFARFRQWLLDVYTGIVGSEIDVEITSEIRQFFNDTLASYEQETEGNSESALRRTARIWKNNLFDSFDIERKFQRVGMGETGFWIKNKYSQEEMYAQEALGVLKSIRKLVGRKNLTDVFLAAESQQAIEAIEDADMKEAVTLLREYFDQSEQEYKVLGGFKKGFKQRYLDELEAELEKAENKGDQEMVEELANRIEAAQDMEFVHIPYSYWFMNQAFEPGGSRKVLRVIESKYKRKNLTISQLIEEGVINKEDVKAEDIMLSYSRRKGRDLALLKIIRAAEKEGAAIKDEEPESEFLKRVPGYLAPALSGYRVNNTLYNWVIEATRSTSKLSLLRKFLNIGKMGAFWNPLFLGMYDTIQSTMTGALSPLRPIQSLRYVKNAIQDFKNQSEEWREARNFGIESKPYASPLQTDVDRFRAAASGKVIGELRTIFRGAGLKDLALSPIRMGKSLYQASWDIAWGLDGIVRQVTYRYYLDQGLNPKEAAQKAAVAHADYASVPPETRRKLNTVFFTPTFKIAMGKFFYNTIKDVGDTFAGRADMQKKDRAAVLMRTVSIMVALDMMMLTLGFERDEWGRRYKRPVDTDIGQRELVVTWSGPHNLFLKYYNRILNSMKPEVENGLEQFWNSTKWEIHPLYRVTSEIVTNRGVNGDKIVSTFDNADIKAWKRFRYFTGNILQMYRQILGEEGLGEEGKELFAKEYGDALAIATGFFTFNYARAPEDIVAARDVQRMLDILKEDIGASRLTSRILSGEDVEDIMKDVDAAEPRIQNALRRIDERIRELEEEYYSYPLAPTATDLQEESDGNLADPDEVFGN